MGSVRSLGGWRVAAMALFGQMWVSAMRKTGCVFTFCILCFVFALKWKSLLYSIPHFCAFVKLKCDFNRFVRFFPDFCYRIQMSVGQDRLILTWLRSGDRKLQRGSARVCPARAANHAPTTVARGPVPRDRSIHRSVFPITVARGPVPRELSPYPGHGGGQAPALRENDGLLPVGQDRLILT